MTRIAVVGPGGVGIFDPAELDGAFDYVLVGVKAHQTAGAADWLTEWHRRRRVR